MRTGLVLSAVLMWGCSGGMGGGGGAHGASGDASSMVGVHAPAFSRPAVMSGERSPPRAPRARCSSSTSGRPTASRARKNSPSCNRWWIVTPASLVVYALSEDETKDGIGAFVKKDRRKVSHRMGRRQRDQPALQTREDADELHRRPQGDHSIRARWVWRQRGRRDRARSRRAFALTHGANVFAATGRKSCA